jgi:hypothetical protein
MPGNNKSLVSLAEHVRALPLADQLVLLRLIAPTIVAELDEQERASLVSEINKEIVRHATTMRDRG